MISATLQTVSAAAIVPGSATPADIAAQRAYLVRYARRRLRDEALVEDVVQDTLLAALQSAMRFRGQATLRTWMTGILVNKIADAVKRERRLAGRLDGLDPSGDVDAGDEIDRDSGGAEDTSDAPIATRHEPVDWHDPAAALEHRQFAAWLERALAALPRQHGDAFALREIDGLANEDAARYLGVTPARTAVLLYRARARLKRAFERDLQMA